MVMATGNDDGATALQQCSHDTLRQRLADDGLLAPLTQCTWMKELSSLSSERRCRCTRTQFNSLHKHSGDTAWCVPARNAENHAGVSSK